MTPLLMSAILGHMISGNTHYSCLHVIHFARPVQDLLVYVIKIEGGSKTSTVHNMQHSQMYGSYYGLHGYLKSV